MKIKTGDKVIVISGRYKGSIGEVKAVSPKTNRVIVEGVNLAKKTLKPSQENPDGGIIEREAPINASNVMVYDDKAKKAGRVASSSSRSRVCSGGGLSHRGRSPGCDMP